MSEKFEDDTQFNVQEPVQVLAKPHRNMLWLRFRLVPESQSACSHSGSYIRLAMTAETAALLLAGLQSAEKQLDMPVAQVEETIVPPAKDRN